MREGDMTNAGPFADQIEGNVTLKVW
jgi:hypothetical protein